MCQFISWIELEGEVFFLDDNKLNTKEGRELLKPDFVADILGHGAIRHYYPELKHYGVDKECSNFSTPDNFPDEVVEAIKKGLFEGFDICPDILTPSAWAEYDKIEKSASAEYDKIEKLAWAEYERIRKPAWAEYDKIRKSASAEYDKIRKPAFWKLARVKKNRKKIWK